MTSRQAVGWLILVCAGWGVSFVVVKGALGYVSPLMLMAIRFGIATAIIAVGHFVPRLPVTRLLALELGVAALLSLAASPLLETPAVVPSGLAVAALLFLGLSGLWSFYMQLRTQQVLSSTRTALVFPLEPVFASLASYLIFAERLTPVQLAGGALILATVAAPALERGTSPVPA